MSEVYELRDRLLALFELYDVTSPYGWEKVVDAVLTAIDDRIEDYRAGIDCAAGDGSDDATRDASAISQLQEALLAKNAAA